jgi:hypothetical protein
MRDSRREEPEFYWSFCTRKDIHSPYGQPDCARSPRYALTRKFQSSPYREPPFDPVTEFILEKKGHTPREPLYSPRNAHIVRPSEPHSARTYLQIEPEPVYVHRALMETRRNEAWRDDWKRKYTHFHRRSPYHENARKTFDAAGCRATEKLSARDRQDRKTRVIECQEYRQNMEDITENAPFVEDYIYAKHNSPIRIVPTADRAACPRPKEPFYNYETDDLNRD